MTKSLDCLCPILNCFDRVTVSSEDVYEKYIADFDDSGNEDSLFSMVDFHIALKYINKNTFHAMETWDYCQIICTETWDNSQITILLLMTLWFYLLLYLIFSDKLIFCNSFR